MVDMYRLVIEHPEWIPEQWQRRLNLRDGHDKGRIYRISKKGSQLTPPADLSGCSNDDLLAELESQNGTRRDLAHLEIIWRKDVSIVPLLAESATQALLPETRIQCLSILEELEALDEPILLELLADSHPHVHKHAVSLSEPWLSNKDSEITQKIFPLAKDENNFVVQQVAYSLGSASHPDAGKTLAQILLNHGEDSYVRSAALSSVIPHLSSVVTEVAESLPHVPEETTSALVQTALGIEDETSLALIFFKAAEWDTQSLTIVLHTIESSGWSLKDLNGGAGKNLESAIVAFDKQLSRKASTIKDPSTSPEDQRAAISLLGGSLSGVNSDLELLLSLLSPQNPIELQKAAIGRATKLGTLEIAQQLLQEWDSFGATVRKEALATFLSRRSWTGLFMGKLIEQPQWTRLLDASQRSLLLNHRDELIRKQASEILGNKGKPGTGTMKKFESSLTLTPDLSSGQQNFTVLCASCHKVGDTGFHVGPDLASLSNLSRESLLNSLINPNQAVESKYAMHTAQTKDGRTVSGILSSETGSGVTILGPAGVNETILRSQLQSLENTGISLMPEGLATGLDAQGMADLLGFLQSSGSVAPVSPDDDGSIRLTPSNGTAAGNLIAVDSGLDAFSWIGAEDHAEWIADIPAGRYSIFFDASRSGGETVSDELFSLTIGDSTIHGAVQFTGGLSRFRKRLYGEIHLAKPLREAKVSFEHRMTDGEMSLREIAIIPQ